MQNAKIIGFCLLEANCIQVWVVWPGCCFIQKRAHRAPEEEVPEDECKTEDKNPKYATQGAPCRSQEVRPYRGTFQQARFHEGRR